MSVLILIGLLFLQGVTGVYYSFKDGYSANSYAYHLGILATALSLGHIAVAVGLLKRKPLARWFAMGLCLLMVVFAVLGPILMFFFAKYAIVIAFVLGGLGKSFGDGVGSIVAALVVAALMFVLCGVVGYRALKALRSPHTRADFEQVVDEGGNIRDEPFRIVVISAVVWLVASFISSKDISISRSSLPRVLMSLEMRQAEDREREKDLAEITKIVMFTHDSKRVIIAPSKLSPEYLVLDLDSGELERTGVNQLFAEQFDYRKLIAPDGSSVLTYGSRIWMKNGVETKLQTLPYERLGFYTPTRFLAYERKAQALQLVDLNEDRLIYAVPVRRDQRGEPSARNGNDGGWTNFSQAWSNDREHFAWLYRNGTIAVLTLATGRIDEETCSQCMYGGSIGFSADGRVVFVPDPVTHLQTDTRPNVGRLYDLSSRTSTPAEYQGDPQYFDGVSGHAEFYDHENRTLVHSDLPRAGRVWRMEMPEGMAGVRRQTHKLLLASVKDPGNVKGGFLIGQSRDPEDSLEIPFKPLPHVIPDSGLMGLSADSRFALFGVGSKLEVVDLEAVLRGEPASRTLDLMKDDKLSAVERATSDLEGRTLRWVEDERSMLAADPALTTEDELQMAFEAARASRANAGETMAAPQAESPAVQEPAPETRAMPEPAGIHKCVDGSGSVTFTQTVCPAGTKAVVAPPIDGAGRPAYAASSRELPAYIPNSQNIPQYLRSFVQYGDKLSSAQQERVSCPGNPYALKKPDGGIQQLNIETGVTRHEIRRASGKIDTVYTGGWPEQRVFHSRNEAVNGSCEMSASDSAKRMATGKFP
jgi:hypothetical protein